MKFGTQCHSTKTLLKIGFTERCTKLKLALNKGNFFKNKGISVATNHAVICFGHGLDTHLFE